MPRKMHRIDLGVFEDMDGEWVDIPALRSFGSRLDVQQALGMGTAAFNLARVAAYVSAWSFDADPTDSAAVRALPDDIMTYVLETAEAYYERTRRTPAERKSVTGADGAVNGATGPLAGDGLGGGGDTADLAPELVGASAGVLS